MGIGKLEMGDRKLKYLSRSYYMSIAKRIPLLHLSRRDYIFNYKLRIMNYDLN